MRLDELASMALFARVVRLGSFTAAANEARLAKSAVSKRVAALERRHGVRLLARTTRRLSPTEEGLRFYEQCAALVAAAEAAERGVAGVRQRPAGKVRVDAPITFAQTYLARPVAAFLAAHPDVEVELTTENRQVDLVAGGLDVVLRVARLQPSSLVARKLAPVELVVVGAPSYLARAGTPRTPADLVHHECLHYAVVPREAEWRFGRGAAARPYPARGRLASTDGTVLREAAAAGLGLAVMPDFMAAPALAAGRLVRVLEDHPMEPAGLHALHADRRLVPARVRAFLDALGAHFARPDWAALAAP
ncbi:MAG: LysR family transcriptional regulator [Anaeromyxobacteraceae bacterium]